MKPSPLALMTWRQTGGGVAVVWRHAGSHCRTWKRNRSRGGPEGANWKARTVVCVSATAGRTDVEAVSRVVGCAAEAPRGDTATGGNSSADEADGEAEKSKGGGSRFYSPSPLAMTRWQQHWGAGTELWGHLRGKEVAEGARALIWPTKRGAGKEKVLSLVPQFAVGPKPVQELSVWQVLDSGAASGAFCQWRDTARVASRLADLVRVARCLSSYDQPCPLRVPLLWSH